MPTAQAELSRRVRDDRVMPKTPDDVRQLAKEAKAKIVDLKFTDLPGVWQHFSIPLEDLNDELFKEGIGFDGSSIRGFQSIHVVPHHP